MSHFKMYLVSFCVHNSHFICRDSAAFTNIFVDLPDLAQRYLYMLFFYIDPQYNLTKISVGLVRKKKTCV